MRLAAIGDSQGGICVQCALKEFVELLEQGIDPMTHPSHAVGGRFEGNPLEHMQQVHPDPEACQREREDLERRAAVGFERLKARKRALAENAQNN